LLYCVSDPVAGVEWERLDELLQIFADARIFMLFSEKGLPSDVSFLEVEVLDILQQLFQWIPILLLFVLH
jgi:hypothetical protein